MSQTKYKLDYTTRGIAIRYVRKYEEYKRRLAQMREDILRGAPPPPDGQPRGSSVGDSTASKAQRLEQLSLTHEAQVIRAIDQAMAQIGADLAAWEDQETLRREVWKACFCRIDFEQTKSSRIMGYCKFYEYKRQFLWMIKNELAL